MKFSENSRCDEKPLLPPVRTLPDHKTFSSLPNGCCRPHPSLYMHRSKTFTTQTHAKRIKSSQFSDSDFVEKIVQKAKQIKSSTFSDSDFVQKIVQKAKRIRLSQFSKSDFVQKKLVLATWRRDRGKVTFQSKQQIWGTYTGAIYPAWFWILAWKK